MTKSDKLTSKLAGFFAAFLVVFAIASVGTAQAETQAPTTINITLTDFKVAVSTNSIPAGVPVTYIITNQGKTNHEVVLEKKGDVDKALEVGDKEYEASDIAPGETRTVVWTIPAAGNYQLGCHVPGHFEMGMVQDFIAAAPAGGTNSPATMPQTGQGGSATATANGFLADGLGLGLVAGIAAFGLIVARRRVRTNRD